MKSTVLTVFAITLLAMAASLPAHAGIVVGYCIAGTQYPTIQAAVNAAPSGAVIEVCPGGYPEQVLIEKPLTLQGIIATGDEGAFILPPSGGLVVNAPGTIAQILVENTTGVTITNLIVDGQNAGNSLDLPALTGASCGPLL